MRRHVERGLAQFDGEGLLIAGRSTIGPLDDDLAELLRGSVELHDLGLAGSSLRVDGRYHTAYDFASGISISPSGTFAIVGNVFFGNGQTSSTNGGIEINTTQNAGNRLELNTFVQNRTDSSNGPGIKCTAGNFTARSNIMSGNLGGTNQYSGTCSHAYSIARPGAVPAGTGNIAGDPLFVNEATGDLHLQSGSPARGAGDPATDLTGIAKLDIDGDVRATPPDIGADQFKP